MIRTGYFAIAASMICVAGMFAQTLQTGNIVYQQAGAIGGVVSSDAKIRIIGPGGFNPQTVAGSPFSATDQSHSLQVLGDGTRIERTESHRLYRDSQGRTRTESGAAGSRIVTIQDPVAGTMVTLNEAARTAEKSAAPRMQMQLQKATAGLAAARVQIQGHIAGDGPATVTMTQGLAVPGSAAVFSSTKPDTEELPAQNINGVLASGKRTTLTIPAGEIGNDRPIRVVGETWYSNDLQMMVKSSNTDPRFGDTNFELTSINRVEPDPSLFQIPADYNVVESKAFFNMAVPAPPSPPPLP